jgi:hypothetical protein
MVGTARSAPLPTLRYPYAFVMPGLDLGIHVFAAYFQRSGNPPKATARQWRHTFNLYYSARLADISTAPPIG